MTTVHKDPEALTMRLTAELGAGVERAWQLIADPRQLERWWGPPTYPATFVDHDLSPGGRVTYFMTGPEGDKHHGWWDVMAADPPHRLEVKDGFASDDGTPDPDMPTVTMVMTLVEQEGRTLLTVETRFPSLAAMERLTEMGMEEGMQAAMGQMDAILADSTG